MNKNKQAEYSVKILNILDGLCFADAKEILHDCYEQLESFSTVKLT